jgi:nucleoside-diphosphate-sugar epimerase
MRMRVYLLRLVFLARINLHFVDSWIPQRRTVFLKKSSGVALRTQQTNDLFVVTGSNGYVGRAVVHELVDHVASAEKKDDNKVATILCLVRPKHITSEQSYWNEVQQQRTDSDLVCSIHVCPYDMLDHGQSFQQALNATLHNSQSDNVRNVTSSSESLPYNICVFHVASVFGPTELYQQTALDNVRGTTDLINALGNIVLKNKSIIGACKFILTSSMAAVRGTGQTPLNALYYTSDDWNTNSIVNNTAATWGTYYQWSKMESERQAWSLCNDRWKDSIDMIALCPSFVFGPPRVLDDGSTTTSSSYSISLVNQWLSGTSPVQSRLFVDIRDAARAHVLAAITDAAIGQRILLSTEARISSQEVALWLQEATRHYSNEKLNVDANTIHFDADFTGGSIPIGSKEVDASEKLHKLFGMKLRPVKETIMDMAEVLLLSKPKI